MKNIFVNLLFISLLFASCFVGPKEQEPQENIQNKKIDSLMTYSHNNGMFNGCITILKNDTVVFKKSYGGINKDTENKINPETTFYIASISKQFTAMGIMILEERGLLSYDDAVNEYFPKLVAINENATIRNLLQHTSGISDRAYYQLKNPNNQDVIDKLASLEPLSLGVPDKRFSYSNTGYVLLAKIIEKVSEKSIDDFFQKEIFNPLEMTRTTTSKEKVRTDTNNAIPYSILGKESTYNSSVIGPGGIYSTINDLTKWNSGINKNILISKETLELAFTNGKVEEKEIRFSLGVEEFGYGFGWMPFMKNNYNYVRHDGSTEGYRSLIRKNLSKNIDIVLLTNHGGALAMDEITNGIDDILETEIYTKPNIPLPNKIMNELNKEGIYSVVDMLKRTINEDNKPDERVLGRLGYTLQNNERVEEAIELYRVNLALYPKSTNALYVLGEAYLLQEKYELAKEIYKQFIAVKPNSEYANEKLKLINKKLKNGN